MARSRASSTAIVNSGNLCVSKSPLAKFFVVGLLFYNLFTTPAFAAPLSNPTAVCSSNCKVDFPYSSANYYAWTVPRSDTYTLELWGAQGGGGVNYYGAGGAGGYVKGDIFISSGTVLYIYPGQAGVRYNSGSITAFNGGGAGNPNDGFSGGGATHIATAVGVLSTLASNQSDVIAVAGGGGGGAGSSSNYSGYTPAGGVGGGLIGGVGPDSNQSSIRGKGSGGTQSSGGAAGLSNDGVNELPAVAATFGLGGSANAYTGDAIQGGGGGGGWYGGGPGSHRGGAGAGGSSYVSRLSLVTNLSGSASVVNPDGSTTTGRLGSGYVRITYSAPVPITLQTYSISGTISKGSQVAITATVNTPGKVTFLANGKRIPGCVSISTSGGAPYSVVCNWKPSTRGNVEISFSMTPLDSSLSTATASASPITVNNRASRR